jgi:hypothetical protein
LVRGPGIAEADSPTTGTLYLLPFQAKRKPECTNRHRNFCLRSIASRGATMNAITSIIEAGDRIDFRLVFLERAAARLMLVNAGEMDLGEAVDGLGVSLHCECNRELIERWERVPPVKPKPAPKRQPPQSTFDALAYELRTHGIDQLQQQSCRRRLGDLSTEQTRKLIETLLRLQPKYPAISDELISKLGDYL